MSRDVTCRAWYDPSARQTVYTVTVSDSALLKAALLDPIDRLCVDSPIKSPADFAQSLEIVLRSIERGMNEAITTATND